MASSCPHCQTLEAARDQAKSDHRRLGRYYVKTLGRIEKELHQLLELYPPPWPEPGTDLVFDRIYALHYAVRKGDV